VEFKESFHTLLPLNYELYFSLRNKTIEFSVRSFLFSIWVLFWKSNWWWKNVCCCR